MEWHGDRHNVSTILKESVSKHEQPALGEEESNIETNANAWHVVECSDSWWTERLNSNNLV